MNAVLHPSKNALLQISKAHNALVSIKSLCEVDNAVLSPSDPSYASIYVKFLLVGGEDQTIISNHSVR